jgi:hypothetical protein
MRAYTSWLSLDLTDSRNDMPETSKSAAKYCDELCHDAVL